MILPDWEKSVNMMQQKGKEYSWNSQSSTFLLYLTQSLALLIQGHVYLTRGYVSWMCHVSLNLTSCPVSVLADLLSPADDLNKGLRELEVSRELEPDIMSCVCSGGPTVSSRRSKIKGLREIDVSRELEPDIMSCVRSGGPTVSSRRSQQKVLRYKVSNKLMSSLYKSNVVFVQIKCCLCTNQILSLYKSNVVFVQIKCCLCTNQMLSLYKANVVFVNIKCFLCTKQMLSL